MKYSSAIHKKTATREKCNMKRLLHKKVQHGNGAVWKKCNMKKFKLPQWNTERCTNG